MKIIRVLYMKIKRVLYSKIIRVLYVKIIRVLYSKIIRVLYVKNHVHFLSSLSLSFLLRMKNFSDKHFKEN